jgi:hypothetical protein
MHRYLHAEKLVIHLIDIVLLLRTPFVLLLIICSRVTLLLHVMLCSAGPVAVLEGEPDIIIIRPSSCACCAA